MGPNRFTALITAIVLSAPQPAAAQEPTLGLVLERAAGYVAEFHRRLSSIVAEEQYVQDWKLPTRAELRGARDLGHRELRSDLLLVKPGDDAPWTEFRDVFEVDGTLIRDRNQRLVKMFLEPSESTAAQISVILGESARFNIGDVDRNINTPNLSLRFLEAANQPRFRLTQTADRTPGTMTGGAAASADGIFRVSTEVWAIAYDEIRRDTMIRTTDRRDLPAHGRFWIEPATGRVLMSELIIDSRRVQATIDVSFQSEPLLGMLVPIGMRERYANKRTNTVVEGRATYGRFRQFQVNVDEKFAPLRK